MKKNVKKTSNQLAQKNSFITIMKHKSKTCKRNKTYRELKDQTTSFYFLVLNSKISVKIETFFWQFIYGVY